MINDMFKDIFDNAFKSEQSDRSFGSVWMGNRNPVKQVGAAAKRSMRDLGTRLTEEREGFDSGGALDLENYFGDLDALQEGLAQVAGSMSEFDGNPIRDRATLRAARHKAVSERMRAKQILQSQEGVQHLDEVASYLDPITGETRELRGEVSNEREDMGNLYTQASQYFNQRVAALRAETGGSADDAVLRLAGASGDFMSQGNTDLIMDQMRHGFSDLAGRSAAGQMQAYQAELQTRQQAAMSELEQRKKANVTATDTEKKRIKQAAAIDKSITDINTMFVQTDAEFAASLQGGGTSGVDFRADRPS